MFDLINIKSMSHQVVDVSLIYIFDLFLFFYINFYCQFDVFSPSLAHWGDLKIYSIMRQ